MMAPTPAEHMPAHQRPTFGAATDIGLVRDHNEDSFVAVPPLFAVCDGMGGHAAGEVASEIAATTLLRLAPPRADATALGQAVEQANLAVLRAAAEGAGRAGMGTTCTAAVIENEHLVVAQVGDSRAYLLHNGMLQQLTRDHSLVADLVESGHITPDEARWHPKRSVITRALGSDPNMQADLYEMGVSEGDRLLLCSDGLYSMVEDARIADVLKGEPDPSEVAELLVEEALAAGGHDNVTVIVADVTGTREQRRHKIARRTKVTAIVVAVLAVALIVGSVVAFNWWTNQAAFLGDVEGNVAIYRGVPGDFLGAEFFELESVTDVETDELPPGVANRVRDRSIRCDSVDAARDLILEYERELAKDENRTRNADAAAASGSSASSAEGAADPSAAPADPSAAPEAPAAEGAPA